MRSNYHTHSDFCDGRASVAAMAEAAFAAGYRILGFSSHAPLPFPASWVLSRENLPAYVAEVRRVGGIWRGRGMEILLGLEIDWIEGLQSPRDPLFAGLGLDYRLGSVHFIQPGPGEAFTVDEPFDEFEAHAEAAVGKEGQKLYHSYYRALAGMIEEGGFDILGHLDLVRVNNRGGRWFDEESRDYRQTALDSIDGLRGRDFVVELNLGGMIRGKISNPYPSLPILRRLRELGTRITVGIDAHDPGHFGRGLETARELARTAGYRSIAVLSHGNWTEAGLDEI